MKKIISTLCALMLVFGIVGTAGASTYFFDFEDGIYDNGTLPGLEAYMESIFPYDVDVGDFEWYGESGLFGSDTLYTTGSTSTLDFDTVIHSASDFEITGLSFMWGVYDATSGIDIGLDVYDDTITSWRNNVWTKYSQNYRTGFTGDITFAPAWEITRFRIHDSGSSDVGMDNLTLYTNIVTGVPEPATLLLLGFGLLGLAGLRRKE